MGPIFQSEKLQILGSQESIVAENLSKYFDKVVIYDPMSSESAKSFLSQKGVKKILEFQKTFTILLREVMELLFAQSGMNSKD